MTKRKCYTFFWLTGKREVLPGRDPAAAMNQAGYSSGALRALAFYAAGDSNEYTWYPQHRKWMKSIQGASSSP